LRVLELNGVNAGYGVGQVLHNVSFTIGAGEVVALVGPNGAGKSTALDVISGVLRPSRGNMTWDGHDLAKMSPARVVRSGVAHCPQGRRVFPYMSTEANLRVGAFTRKDHAAVKAEIDEFFGAWPVLGQRRGANAGTLSGGEQQILAIGRSLMSRPRLLLLDEPSLGLAPVLVSQVYEVLRHVITERGVSILLVEQNVVQALTLADRVLVLAGGRLVFEGMANDTDADQVASHYFEEAARGNGAGQ
jgi:branched-chain amino acid transport system ATP-binding protein